MRLFKFRANDPSSDDGHATIIVKASSSMLANRYIRDEKRRKHRTDLQFEFVEEIEHKSIIYSNMEAGNDMPSQG